MNAAVDAGGHHETASASRTMHDAARGDAIVVVTRSVGDVEKRVSTPSTWGGTNASATSCACGCSIDAPAAPPVVHERLRVHEAGVEVVRGTVADREQHRRGRVGGERVELGVMVG